MAEPIDRRYEWLLDLRRVAPALPGTEAEEKTESAAEEGHSGERAPTRALGQIPFLKGLQPAEIKRILRICTVNTYEPGQQICSADSGGNEMYILISGQICARAKSGDQVVAITPITTVGEMGFMTDHRRPTSLEAVDKSRVICIQKERFESMLHSDIEIQVRVQQNVIDILSGKMVGLLGMVEKALSGTGSSAGR